MRWQLVDQKTELNEKIHKMVQPMSSDTNDGSLKQELTGLFHYIQRVRDEIAAIHRPADDEHRFER